MKTGALPARRTAEIAAHGHAVGVAVLGEVVAINIREHEVPAREHADDRTVARGGVDFLALERVKDSLASVLACPHTAKTCGLFAPDGDQRPLFRVIVKHDERGFPPVGRRQSVGKLTEEVILPRGDHADMGIIAADQSGLCRGWLQVWHPVPAPASVRSGRSCCGARCYQPVAFWKSQRSTTARN